MEDFESRYKAKAFCELMVVLGVLAGAVGLMALAIELFWRVL